MARASSLACERGLRGYDSVYLAAALEWRKELRESIAIATNDRELWRGATANDLAVWPAVTP